MDAAVVGWIERDETQRKADAAYQRSHDLADRILLGQPILVGQYSSTPRCSLLLGLECGNPVLYRRLRHIRARPRQGRGHRADDWRGRLRLKAPPAEQLASAPPGAGGSRAGPTR